MLISICIYCYKHIQNAVKAKYLRYNIIYLVIFLLIMSLMIFKWMFLGYHDLSLPSAVMRLTRYSCEILLISMRLYEPGCRQFLKDRIKLLKDKLRYLSIKIRRRSQDNSSRFIDEIVRLREPRTCSNPYAAL